MTEPVEKLKESNTQFFETIKNELDQELLSLIDRLTNENQTELSEFEKIVLQEKNNFLVFLIEKFDSSQNSIDSNIDFLINIDKSYYNSIFNVNQLLSIATQTVSRELENFRDELRIVARSYVSSVRSIRPNRNFLTTREEREVFRLINRYISEKIDIIPIVFDNYIQLLKQVKVLIVDNETQGQQISTDQ